MKKWGKKLDNIGTIYKIESLISGKIYIGITKNFKVRIRTHISRLINNKHENKYLQNYFNKYKDSFENVFSITILENCELSVLADREKFYINHFKSHIRKYGFNLTLGGEYGSGTSDIKKEVHRELAPEIYVYNLKGEFINKYRSPVDASEFLNLKRQSVINALNRGIQLKGFLFYKNPKKFTNYEIYSKKTKGKIFVYNKNKKLLFYEIGMVKLAKDHNLNINSINSACRRFSLYKNKYYFVKEKDLLKFKELFNLN